MEFQNKTVVIAGGASGMGFLCGKCFGERGAAVVLLDVTETVLEEKAAQLRSMGIQAMGIPTDVRDYQQITDARDKAVETFGSIDIAISCAGGSATRIWECRTEFKDTPMEVFDWGLDVNLKGPFYLGHAVMKQMAQQKSGVIIHLGSVTGEEGSAHDPSYAAAKSGLMYGFTKSLALYGAQYNVQVCCVSPGPVLTRPAMANMKTLMGRAAEPQEVIDLILYLCSDKAAFITGTNYFIDGGRTIMCDKVHGGQ